MVQRSNHRTNLVGLFSFSALIESTNIVIQPNLIPPKISVNGLSPTITASDGIIPLSSRYFFITVISGFAAEPTTSKSDIALTLSKYSILLLFINYLVFSSIFELSFLLSNSLENS